MTTKRRPASANVKKMNNKCFVRGKNIVNSKIALRFLLVSLRHSVRLYKSVRNSTKLCTKYTKKTHITKSQMVMVPTKHDISTHTHTHMVNTVRLFLLFFLCHLFTIYPVLQKEIIPWAFHSFLTFIFLC